MRILSVVATHHQLPTTRYTEVDIIFRSVINKVRSELWVKMINITKSPLGLIITFNVFYLNDAMPPVRLLVH